MENSQKKFVGRADELERLTEFVNSEGSGMMHLRGRRRIGKSWLLMELTRRVGGLYFQGEQDSSTRQLLVTLASLWDEYTGQTRLSVVRRTDLTWDMVLTEIAEQAKRNPKQSFLLVFDEIQWVAKRNSGFVSKIKRAWLSWESVGNIKVIICGSSNRFFEDKTARQSSILRGLRTHADVWVKPFSLREVERFFFPKWSREEIAFVYMMTGGVPYYLNQITETKNFINGINKAFFSRSTIFLDEINEIVNLDFNSSSRARILAILRTFRPEGRTVASVTRITGMAESSVRESVEKLLEYGLIFEKGNLGAKKKKNKSGTKYYMRDFFLNFYFRIIEERKETIAVNTRKNIFSKLIGSKYGYYIPDFSGPAFELLVESVVARRSNNSMEESIFKKLGLSERTYEWGHYFERGMTRIDLVAESSADRESRVIEVKWISDRVDLGRGYIDEVLAKSYTPPRGYRLSFHLVLSNAPSKGLKEVAAKNNVTIHTLDDLF